LKDDSMIILDSWYT